MKILVSAGEASGDAVGAALVSELKGMGCDCEFFALGGKRLAAAGVTLLADSSRWGAIGIYQSLKVAPKIASDLMAVSSWMKANRPILFIAIDFGYTNIKLCRKAKKLGTKTLYFMPPGSWRRDKQGKDLPFVADRIATPFDWSADRLREMGANAEWVGHPILQMAKSVPEGVRDMLAILPGSRKHEIDNNLPEIAKAVERMNIGLQPQIALAPTADQEQIEKVWVKYCSKPIKISNDGAVATLKSAKAGIVCSGTATLEAAVSRCPFVLMYRFDRIMELEARLRRPKFEYLALPSILLGKPVVPELIQYDATAERLAEEIDVLSRDTPERAAQLAAFDELLAVLGPEDAVSRTARMALDLIGESVEPRNRPTG